MKEQFVAPFSAVCLGVSLLFTGCAGSSNNSPTPTTTTPPVTAVTVASIAPATLTAGAPATTITVTGSGFVSGTAIQVGGSTETTTYVSSTEVTASIPVSQLSQGAVLSVIALNGNSTSASGPVVDLTVNNPAPAITQIVPSSLSTGATDTTIAISGSGFVPTTTIQSGTTKLTTVSISSTQVNAVVSAGLLVTPGNLSLTAVNPTPGGGTSSASSIAINNPVPGPGITLAPATLPTGGSSPAAISVSGANFLPSSVVQVNGANRTSAFVNSAQLTFQLSAAEQASAAKFTVTVVNPAPGGGTSSAATLTVAGAIPTPVITQLYPTSLTVGSPATTLYVSGSNLASTQTVQWNGSPLVSALFTDNYGDVYLSANVPANLLASAGTVQVIVLSPTSTPILSNALPITIGNPPAPTLSAISPSTGLIHTAATITLTGTGFTQNSTVALNGTNIAATYVNASSMTVSVPASSVDLPGNLSFTVTTPAPGGGTTAPLVYTAYIALPNNSVIYNAANGLFYASVPSSAGAPYGNSIVSIDPETGALGTPIPVGSEPDKLALSSDGTILWVGLDGASAVRQVNLTTSTAGLQFTLGGNTGIYASPVPALALAALPGSPNSVIVSTTTDIQGLDLAIYDSGVIRGTATNTQGIFNSANALQVNGTRQEVYAASSSGFYTYNYGPSGLTPLASSSTNANYTNYSSPEIQIAGGRLYTDFGQVFDAESGSLLGSFYSSGTNLASGAVTADTTLGRAFVLDQSAQYTYNYNQIQTFNLSDFNPSSSAVIPVSVSTNLPNSPSTLTRWGTNGLAFRTSGGLYSLHSNLVKDLSASNADLSVSLTSSGGTTTGASTTYIATISNAGPSASTNIALTALMPASGILSSITPASGTCSTFNAVSCNLGGLASGASSTVTFVVQQTTAGSVAFSAQVTGSENDPNTANNQAALTVSVMGAAYNLAPTVTQLSPQAIASGASDTVVTITGSGFSSSTTAQLGATALTTSYTNPTTLTVTVPAAQLKTLGWAPLTVSNPTPGGGTSTPLPLTIYQVLTVGINHVLYEPFSRKIYAAIGSGSSSVTGNSIAQITPETGAISTPVYVGSQPSKMAFSDDGNLLYSLLTGANSIARFNVATNQTEFSISPTVTNYGGATTGFRDVAVQTGSENTIVVDFGYTSGMAIIDVDPVAKTGTIRGSGTGLYTGTSLHFYDANTLYLFNTDTWQTLDQYSITPAGFSFDISHKSSTLLNFGTFRLIGKIGYADAGGAADVTTKPATQMGIFKPVNGSTFASAQVVAPDPSLAQVFFFASTGANPNISANGPDGLVAYNPQTYMPQEILPLNIGTIEGSASYSPVDLIRWGQDGLAALTSTGHLYILRGAAVVPGELTTSTAATLVSSSSSTITHGAGNTMLTLTGTNFLPGVAVNWNGSYRTTTIVDPTHVTVAVPASDLATAGAASLTATNPGAPPSSAITFTIN